MQDLFTCFKCGHTLEKTDFGRQDQCPQCHTSTHCCLNCTHYDSTRYNECTEPIAERVVDKEKANFCDYFKPLNKSRTKQPDNSRQEALKKAEALFKKK